MKWISKHLKPKKTQNIWDGNPYVHVLKVGHTNNSFKVQIGDNIIENLLISSPTNFWKQDFSKTSLSFLLKSSFHAHGVHIKPVKNNPNNYYIAFFNGDWMSGDLVCDEFTGNISGGTLQGVYKRKIDNKALMVHPSANVQGAYNHLSKKSDQTDDPHPVYGIGPYSESLHESIHLLALNTGQAVEFETVNQERFSFYVQKSYKETGIDIHLIELTHNKRKHIISWPDLIGAPEEFDSRSIISVGKRCEVVKLFSEKKLGTITEIRVKNQIDNKPVFAADTTTTFKPILLKF